MFSLFAPLCTDHSVNVNAAKFNTSDSEFLSPDPFHYTPDDWEVSWGDGEIANHLVTSCTTTKRRHLLWLVSLASLPEV
jgi:hypothetical protein